MPESVEPSPGACCRETILLALAVVAVLLARQDLSVPVIVGVLLVFDPTFFFVSTPQLSEPFYSALKYDVAYLSQLQGNANVEVTPHVDRQNQVAFYTIRFRPR